MMIKSTKIIYPSILYHDSALEEVQTYKYLGIDFYFHLNQNRSVKKRITGGWNAYYNLENKCRNVMLQDWR